MPETIFQLKFEIENIYGLEAETYVLRTNDGYEINDESYHSMTKGIQLEIVVEQIVNEEAVSSLMIRKAEKISVYSSPDRN